MPRRKLTRPPQPEVLWAVYSRYGSRVSGLYPLPSEARDIGRLHAGTSTWKAAYAAGYRCWRVTVTPEGGNHATP